MRPLSFALSVLKNQIGAVPRPSWCTYLVTYRCNARCKMCDSWRMKPGDELTPQQVGEVFGKIGRLDVVRLSGGEPFLREDMLDIAEQVNAKSRPMVIHITSNGSYPDRIEKFVTGYSKPSMLRFMISFDGLPTEHDKNRGKDVTFETAVETVRTLAGLRDKYGVQVSANHTVINPQSLEDNAGIREILQPLGCDVHSVLAYSDSAMYGARRRGQKAEDLISSEYPLHPMLQGADVVGFVEEEEAAIRDLRAWWLRWGKRYYLRGLKARLARYANSNGNSSTNGKSSTNGNGSAASNGNGAATTNGTTINGATNGTNNIFSPRPKPKCVALRSHIRLLPDGRVPVCQFNTETVGSLRDQSFNEVWHNEDTKRSRKWVDACVGCWAECEVMPNALYSGDIVRL